MSYIKASLFFFIISLCLLLIGLLSEEMKTGLIVSGMIMNYIGIAVFLTGAIKRGEHYSCEKYFKQSEEHTSELQSRFELVCRLLLEKKKKTPKEETK